MQQTCVALWRIVSCKHKTIGGSLGSASLIDSTSQIVLLSLKLGEPLHFLLQKTGIKAHEEVAGYFVLKCW